MRARTFDSEGTTEGALQGTSSPTFVVATDDGRKLVRHVDRVEALDAEAKAYLSAARAQKT